jgi:two-component system, chemotaxis family, CheB/CheR fusion protein
MHKLLATSTILEHELSELRLLVERQTGVALDCPNSALAAHISDYIEAQDPGSSCALLEQLRSADQDISKLSSLLDGLVNANTGFYRHPGALNALAQHVVPQLCARKSVDGPSALRIWSAGCATGEEAYSIAMAVCDSLNQSAMTPANIANPSNGNGAANQKTSRNGGIAESVNGGSSSAKSVAPFSLHIVGSDLIPRNIEAADRGVYPQSALDGLPPATIRNYFSKIGPNGVVPPAAAANERQGENGSRNTASGSIDACRAEAGHLLVKPRLRSLVTFNCMNLARPGYIGRFDIIFCMDVLPHMSRAQRIALIERLHLYLEPGGYLFLSQTEKLINSNLNFRSETYDGYTFHRKPLAASAAYGR